MANLLFRPADLQCEIEALRVLAATFIDPTSFSLEELASDLRGLVTQGTGVMKLEIPKNRPLRTRTSAGEFEPAEKSSNRPIVAEVTGVWDIAAVTRKLKKPDRPNSKARPTSLIEFTGLASTVVTVCDVRTGDLIACWKMEIGDPAAPGCFFHTFASADHEFPVPRHPNVFPTPMAAIGFALGELFQESWERVLSETTLDPPQRWRSIQEKRLKALLEWQSNVVATATACPWLAIKAAKPSPEIFVWSEE